MPSSSVEVFWSDAYRVLYDTWMQELISEELAKFWGRFNALSSVLVAATATGSVIAGWTIFSTASGKVTWSVLAGVAALLSLIDTSLGVGNRVKEQSDLRSVFVALRVKLEHFCHSLQRLDVASAEVEFRKLQNEHESARKNARGDIIWTKNWQRQTQLQLNEILADRGYASRESTNSKAETGSR